MWSDLSITDLYLFSNCPSGRTTKVNLCPQDSFKVRASFAYTGILEKGSYDIGSAVCYTTYTIYLSLWTQTTDPISS